ATGGGEGGSGRAAPNVMITRRSARLRTVISVVFPELPPVTTVWPSGLTARAVTGPSWARNEASFCPVATFRAWTWRTAGVAGVSRAPADSRVALPGRKARAKTGPANLTEAVSLSVVRSHSFSSAGPWGARAEPLPEASVLLSGENARERTTS